MHLFTGRTVRCCVVRGDICFYSLIPLGLSEALYHTQAVSSTTEILCCVDQIRKTHLYICIKVTIEKTRKRRTRKIADVIRRKLLYVDISSKGKTLWQEG